MTVHPDEIKKELAAPVNMSDLISRGALLKKIAHHTMFDCLKRATFENANTYEQVKGAMFELAQKAPAVDAAPVVHARWGKAEIVGYDGLHAVYGQRCSNCGEYTEVYIPRFCPNCGAKMDGGASNA